MLAKYRCQKDPTHVSMLGGKYRIEDDNELIRYMAQELVKHGKKKRIKEREVLCMVERLSPVFKLIFDIDNADYQFTKRDMYKIKSDIDNVLQRVYKDPNMVAFITYRDSRSMNKFHINYPNIFVNSRIALDIIDELHCNYKGFIDTSIYKNGSIRYYGSYKRAKNKGGIERNSNYRTMIIPDGQTSEIPKRLIERIHLLKVRTNINKIDDALLTTTYLEKYQQEVVKKPKCHSNLKVDHLSLKFLKKLLSLLKPYRYDRYEHWIDIGIVLYNISDELVGLWDEWSQQSDKYSDEVCEEKWNSFSKGDKTISSLFHYIKEDSPKEYKNLLKSKIYQDYIMNNSILACIHSVRDSFPDKQNLECSAIIRSDNDVYVGLKDRYCPISKVEHAEEELYLQFLPKLMKMMCHHKNCRGRCFPLNGIEIKEEYNNIIFNIQQVNNINNYYGTEDSIYDGMFTPTAILDNVHYNRLLFLSLSGTDNDIAMFLSHYYQDEFRVSSTKPGIWFEFKKHKWIKKDRRKVKLRRLISSEMPRLYEQIKKKVEESDKDERKLRYLNNLVLKVKSKQTKDNIIVECEEVLGEMFPDFDKEVDQNLDLLCYNNGVFDFNEMEFRDGEPEDKITLSTNIDYVQFDPENKRIKEVIAFMEQLFPDEDVRTYVWKQLATCLDGYNREQKFYIWIGCGSNGKSKLVELMQSVMGEYSVELAINLICGLRASSSGPQPEIVNMCSKRFGIFQEPSPDAKFNLGILKEISGGNKVTARALYSNDIESFVPQVKLFLCSNHLPEVEDGQDKGTWRRIRGIEFKSEFIDKPNPDNRYQFKIDKKLGRKMEKWSEAFMSILVEYYKDYITNGITEPESVQEFTKCYKQDSDYFSAFFDEVVYKSVDITTNITPFFKAFKNWYGENIGYSNMPKRDKLKYAIEARYGKMTSGGARNGWHGIDLKNQNDDL
jgi:P4 family phage/plasmid primase-like protien